MATLLDDLPQPYFSLLVASVRRAREQEPGLVDLARGNPEVPPPDHAVRAVCEALEQRPELHGYPPFAGTPELLRAFVQHQREVFGVELDPQREVVVVPGTKTAIALVCMALAGSGDAVLVPDPGYPDYYSGAGVCGARPASLPLDADAGFAPAWGALASRDVEQASMAFLNYPSNPCGTAATPELFAEAVEWSRRNGVPIVHDLAYGELVFGGRRPLSFLATPGARDVGVELVSMSKTYCMAGWRVGFVCGNPAIVSRVRTLLDHLTVGVFTPLQIGAAAALAGPQEFVAGLRETYERRARKVAEALGVPMAEGSYYTWIRLPRGLDAATLLHEHGVALAPGDGFGTAFGAAGSGWARLSVAVPDEQLDAGLLRLAPLLHGSG